MSSKSGFAAISRSPPGSASLATERLENAQRERIWAIVEAHQVELSVRQIAAVTDLSSSRVHQLLGSDEALEIPPMAQPAAQAGPAKSARPAGPPRE